MQRIKAEKIIKEHFEFKYHSQNFLQRGHQQRYPGPKVVLSTNCFTPFYRNWKLSGFSSCSDFMSIDENHEPELNKISEKLKVILANYPEENIFVTQGYICKNHRNEVDNLKEAVLIIRPPSLERPSMRMW